MSELEPIHQSHEQRVRQLLLDARISINDARRLLLERSAEDRDWILAVIERVAGHHR